MTLETLRERRAEVLEVARCRGAKAVWVFGSVARGEATPASDIDFLVEFLNPVDRALAAVRAAAWKGAPTK
ncbi:MAG: nucleotidyltransferase domain-containing protein [Actinomycetota bacterium]|jgi:predicted nucleotidyltransferase